MAADLSLMRAVLFALVIFASSSLGAYHDCGTGSPRLFDVLSFSAYPSSPSPGDYLHIAATFRITQDISSADVSWTIKYQNNTSLLDVSGIQLCNFTSALNCDQLAVTNASIPISFDYLIPDLPYGDYVVTYTVSLPGNFIAYGCISFDININQNQLNGNQQFVSNYEAYLIGSANYSSDGLVVQVGPVGTMDFAQALPWGVFTSISGSADVITPSFDPTYYIWGLTGNRTNITQDNSTGQVNSVYAGRFYVGYIGPYGSWNSPGNFLTEGLFTLNRHLHIDGSVTIDGNVRFYPAGGVFPAGWYNPINLARLGDGTLATDEHGQLVVYSNSSTCLIGNCAPPALITPGSSVSVGRRNLGIILGTILGGLALLALIAVIAWLVHRRHRMRRSEDRVYRSRPNEYGDALVVDDIIQKSRAHRGAALPVLNPRSNGDLPPVYFEQYPMPGGRRSSRTARPIGREPSLRGSMSSRSRAPYSDDESNSEPVRDTSRSRSRSRSPRRRSTRADSRSRRSISSRSSSPDSRRYSDSASGSSRSRSRSRSRSPSASADSREPRR